MSGFPLTAAQVVLAVILLALAAQYVRVLLHKSAVPRRVPARPAVPRWPELYARHPEKRLDAFRELERRLRWNPGQRQEFVDQVLAQLRFRDWSEFPDWQERLWALVVPHLRPGWKGFWPGIDLRLERTILTDVDLSGCEIRDLRFEWVRLVGTARFVRTVFTREATFLGSCFAGHARFREAEFRGEAAFDAVTFTGTASFPGVTVAGPAGFEETRFSGLTDFSGARFSGSFDAGAAGFAGRTSFRDVRFKGTTRFAEARFTGHADFTGTSFVVPPELTPTWARTDRYAVRTWPAGWSIDAEDVVLPKRPGRWAQLRR